jgi:hypothetical protein
MFSRRELSARAARIDKIMSPVRQPDACGQALMGDINYQPAVPFFGRPVGYCILKEL